MKIRIEVDVSPKELREFLGLPDVSGLQEEVITALRDRMVAGVSEFDPLALLKSWMPSGVWSVGEWQRLLRRLTLSAIVEEGEADSEPEKTSSSPARPRKKKATAKKKSRR